MPDLSGPFDAAAFAQAPYFRDRGYLEPSGVQGLPAANVAAGDLALTTNGLTSSLQLGRAHVRGAYYERTGTAWSYTHPANTNPTLARVDRVVLRRDLTAKTVVPAVLQGTAAASPVAVALTQIEDGVWESPLHQVVVPPASGTVLVVVDDRPWIDPTTNRLVIPWITYPVTWTAGGTNPGLGNGTLIGRYRKIDRLCEVDIFLRLGSTSNGGLGAYAFSLPFTSTADRDQAMSVKSFSAAGDHVGYALISPSTAAALPYVPVSNTASNLARARNADNAGTANTGVPLVSPYPYQATHVLAVFGRFETTT